ncbi:MAG: hypothetical protein ACRC23_01510 [Aeromonas jandaei]
MAFIIVQRRIVSSRSGVTVYGYGIAHNCTYHGLEFDIATQFEKNAFIENPLIPVKFDTESKAKVEVMKLEAKMIVNENIAAVAQMHRMGKTELHIENMNKIIRNSPHVSPITTYFIIEENDISEIISMQYMSEQNTKTIEAGMKNGK